MPETRIRVTEARPGWKHPFQPARPGDRASVYIKDHTSMPVRPARQLFILDRALFNAISDAEVKATVRALRELNLYRLPYETIDLRMKADDLIKPPKDCGPLGPEADATFYGVSTNFKNPYTLLLTWTTNKHWWGEIIPKTVKIVNDDSQAYEEVGMEQLQEFLCNVVITMLATRNAEKTTEVNKSVRLGIGKHKDRHEYTTTIRLPRVIEDHPDVPVHTGREVCPHLRRAHIRNQRYGPNWQFTRQVLIEACFVNADKEWTKTRTAYNVSLGYKGGPDGH